MANRHEAETDFAKSLDFTANFKVAYIWAYLLGLRKAEMYCKTLPASDGLAACVDRVVVDHGLQIARIKKAAQFIPRTGALLITANHPTGILDGAVLFCALLSRRSDVKIIANDVLCSVPVLGSQIIPVKKTNAGDMRSLSALMEIRRAWKRGECVVVFPAGTVAHWQWKRLAIADAPWTTNIQDFAKTLKIPECRAELAVKNPAWFHVFAAVSRTARVALLLRAFFSSAGNQASDLVVFNLLGKCADNTSATSSQASHY